MKARLVILIVLAGALAVAFAMRSSAPSPPPEEAEEEIAFIGSVEGEELPDIRVKQTPLGERPLPGVEPPVPPEFSVAVEVDPTGQKNRLYFYITEAHGYYVEGFTIEAWFLPDGVYVEPDQSRLRRTHHVPNRYLEANSTLVECMEFVRPELDQVGGYMGGSENWAARVIRYERARAENPDPLPLISERDECALGG